MSPYSAPEFTRSGNFAIYKFDASQIGAVAKVVGPNETYPMRAQDVMDQYPDVLCCVNGAQFSFAAGTPRGANQVESYAMVDKDEMDFRLMDQSAAINLPGNPSKKSQGASLSVVDGAPHFYNGNTFVAGAVFGAQSFPTLVYNSRAVDSGTGDIVHVTSYGKLKDGRVFFAHDVANRPSFSAKLVSHGAEYAGYCDGGGSARLQVRGGDTLGHPENRRCAAWLVARSTGSNSGGIGNGTASNGNVAGTGTDGTPMAASSSGLWIAGGVVLVAALAGGTWWLASRA